MPMIGPAGASLAVAGALFATGGIAAGVSQYLSRLTREQQLARRPGPNLESAVALAEGFVRDNQALAIAVAFVAGMLTTEETSKSRHP
jgi:hypothetical protein